MTRGLWIVVGILILQGLSYWLYELSFLNGNVWEQHGDIQNADEITRKTDFFALRVVKYVSGSVGTTFSGLIVVLVYLVVRLRRSERRIEELEQAARPAREDSSTTREPSPR